MTFRIGQRIVCIREAVRPIDMIVNRPVVGSVYEVRDIVAGWNGGEIIPGLLLVGLSNPIGPRGIEYNFCATRFSPIQERKTDISIFTKMLTGTKAPALSSCKGD